MTTQYQTIENILVIWVICTNIEVGSIFPVCGVMTKMPKNISILNVQQINKGFSNNSVLPYNNINKLITIAMSLYINNNSKKYMTIDATNK